MTKRVQALLEQASGFSDEERAELAAQLLDSLDSELEEDVEEAWAEEIERRVADLNEGRVETVPWERVRSEALRAVNARAQG